MATFLQGTWTALITPFLPDAEYSIDYEGFKKLLDFQMQNGVTGLVPCGTTGESATMSHETHRDVIKFVLNHVKENAAKFGRKLGTDLFVMPGTGSNATDEAIELTRYAESLGAHATLHVTPYYNKPTPEGMKLHFKLITDATKIPIVIYNIPGRTGKNLEVPTLLEIAKNPQVIGIKDASGEIGQIMKTIYKTRGTDFSVMSGDDNLTYIYMVLGGKGVVSVASNIIPRQLSDFTATMLKGDFKTGLEMHWKMLDFFEALFYETNPGPVKYMASIMGLPAGPMRPPMCLPTPDNQEKIKKVMKAFGVLK
ncbi:MAG: 4-hydroxy-tetrahydrodipicolinate synthase [Candidatus Lokiarchaeota archaeon]|nr:4-hydroxy-tetrahydrodipicolinate synthase [Candidatus Lokiarchaeota archaeon]